MLYFFVVRFIRSVEDELSHLFVVNDFAESVLKKGPDDSLCQAETCCLNKF